MRPVKSKAKICVLCGIGICLSLLVGVLKVTFQLEHRTVMDWLQSWDGANQALQLETTTEPRREVFRRQREAAEDAVYAMGPAALPELVSVVEGIPNSASRATLEMWSEALGWTTHPFKFYRPSQESACQGIAQLGLDALPALPVLSNAFLQPHSPYHHQVMLDPLVALGTNSIPVFLAGLTNADTQVQKSAFYGLRRLGLVAVSTEPELRRLLAHPEPGTRGAALRTLPAVQPRHENPFPLLLPHLRDSHREVREGALGGVLLAASVREATAPEVVEAAAVVAALAEGDELEFRRGAALGIRFLKAAATPHVAVLLRLLGDTDGGVRREAVYSLVTLKLRLPEVIPALAKLLHDRHEDVREAAAAGLRELADEVEKVQPGLIGSLGDLGRRGFEQARVWREEQQRWEARRLERQKARAARKP